MIDICFSVENSWMVRGRVAVHEWDHEYSNEWLGGCLFVEDS